MSSETVVRGLTSRCDVRIESLEAGGETRLEYDLAVCASSFEPRCIGPIEDVGLRSVFQSVGYAVVFGDAAEDEVRVKSDRSLRELCAGRVWEGHVFRYGLFLKWFHESLVSIRKSRGRSARVLFDYSCFPKSYYVGALLAADAAGGCELVFSYDLGERGEGQNWEPSEIDHIYALPGMEGLVAPRGSQAFLFGLGFDGIQAAALEEVLQPRLLYSLVADPGVLQSDAARAVSNNAEVIANSAVLYRAGLGDIAAVTALARDLVNAAGPRTGLVVCPLGPKPHALGLGLAALLNPDVTFLHVAAKNPPRRRVAATGRRERIAVRFEPALGAATTPIPVK